MPIAIRCGACSRNLLATEAGQILKCPHCGARLRVPERVGAVPEGVGAGTDTQQRQLAPADDTLASLDSEAPQQAAPEPLLEFGTTTLNLSADDTHVPTVSRPEAADDKSGNPAIKPTQADVVSRRSFVLLLSYASAVTVAFVLLLLRYLQPNMHALESLPDLEPPQKDGIIAVQLVPPESELPRGHVLELQESQRFGSVELTPLKVTRGPLAFVHFSGNPARQQPDSEPVLKLWLQFKNVSSEQIFTPLDRKLMLTRVAEDEGHCRANTFLCNVDEKTESGLKALVYDMPESSEWNLKDQELGRVLKPGETYVTYIPTTEETVDQLTGELVWRVHFRKGYHPESRRGVTTLVDVLFASGDIEADGDCAVVASAR